MAYPTKTVAVPADITVFGIAKGTGTTFGTPEDFKALLKNVKLKEEVAEIRVDGICEQDEDVEPGKRKWSVDVSKKAALTASALRPGDIVLLHIETGSIVRYGYGMIGSREDDGGSDSDAQSVAFTIRGKKALSLTALT